MTTGKLGTEELEEPTNDTPILTETIEPPPQYSSIDSIKEDEDEEENGSSSIAVSESVCFV